VNLGNRSSSGKLHAPATLPLGKSAPVPNEFELGGYQRGPECFTVEKQSLFHAINLTRLADRHARSQVISYFCQYVRVSTPENIAVEFLNVIPIYIQCPYVCYLTNLFKCYVFFNVFAAKKNQNKLSLLFLRRFGLYSGCGLPFYGVSRSHSNTPHSVGLLWTSDQPHAQTSTWQHTTLTTDVHALGGI
jgi:hypothetical protein